VKFIQRLLSIAGHKSSMFSKIGGFLFGKDQTSEEFMQVASLVGIYLMSRTIQWHPEDGQDYNGEYSKLYNALTKQMQKLNPQQSNYKATELTLSFIKDSRFKLVDSITLLKQLVILFYPRHEWMPK